ncbi:hypothetical protein [Streptomyces goshikiensis]|uniref:hypothetical protein n=1 Tax=Streptomyces goshikiensis TaxID=1942 RepID=UPI0037927E65
MDVIFYEEDTSPAHQDLIKLHELGHVLCGHTQTLELSQLAEGLNHLSPEFVSQALGLGRSNYATDEEQEAEMIAVLLSDLGAAERIGTETSRRLTASLAHPVRSARRWRRR